MNNALDNWKTTLAGVAALLISLGHIVNSVVGGEGISASDLSLLASGVGLILAKDGNNMEAKK